jgi:hypothetical protein
MNRRRWYVTFPVRVAAVDRLNAYDGHEHPLGHCEVVASSHRRMTVAVDLDHPNAADIVDQLNRRGGGYYARPAIHLRSDGYRLEALEIGFLELPDYVELTARPPSPIPPAPAVNLAPIPTRPAPIPPRPAVNLAPIPGRRP